MVKFNFVWTSCKQYHNHIYDFDSKIRPLVRKQTLYIKKSSTCFRNGLIFICIYMGT